MAQTRLSPFTTYLRQTKNADAFPMLHFVKNAAKMQMVFGKDHNKKGTAKERCSHCKKHRDACGNWRRSDDGRNLPLCRNCFELHLKMDIVAGEDKLWVSSKNRNMLNLIFQEPFIPWKSAHFMKDWVIENLTNMMHNWITGRAPTQYNESLLRIMTKNGSDSFLLSVFEKVETPLVVDFDNKVQDINLDMPEYAMLFYYMQNCIAQSQEQECVTIIHIKETLENIVTVPRYRKIIQDIFAKHGMDMTQGMSFIDLGETSTAAEDQFRKESPNVRMMVFELITALKPF